MTTRSEPLKDGERVRKGSAIVSRAALVKQRGMVERVTAWGVLLLSLLGTVVAFHGGWAPVLRGELSIVAGVGGLLAQGVLTWSQWAYGDRKTSWQYLGSLGIDTSLTVWGYGPIVAPALARIASGRGWPEPDLIAWLVVGIFAILIAVYPDNRLVD